MTPFESITSLKEQMSKSIIGQDQLIDRIILALLADGIMWLIAKTKIKWPKWAKKVPPYAIGSMASFWMIERIWGFF